MEHETLSAPISFYGGIMPRKNATQNQRRKNEEEINNREEIILRTNLIKCYNDEQREALELIKNNTISFLIGEAGTGKTHIAIAYAMSEFLDKRYKKIIMTRPAVEAGERLGHLPGAFEEKVHPYMIPLLDFLEEKLEKKYVKKYFEEGQFEIAPLAYMRGRTLKDSIIIGDELQNATKNQILMLMTRIGKGSKMIITGDPNQSDINGKGKLLQISQQLSKIDSIGAIKLVESVRHPLIGSIIKKFNDIE